MVRISLPFQEILLVASNVIQIVNDDHKLSRIGKILLSQSLRQEHQTVEA